VYSRVPDVADVKHSGDIEFTIDGMVTIEEVTAIWYAVKYDY